MAHTGPFLSAISRYSTMLVLVSFLTGICILLAAEPRPGEVNVPADMDTASAGKFTVVLLCRHCLLYVRPGVFRRPCTSLGRIPRQPADEFSVVYFQARGMRVFFTSFQRGVPDYPNKTNFSGNPHPQKLLRKERAIPTSSKEVHPSLRVTQPFSYVYGRA